MSADHLLTEESLMEWSGYQRRADIMHWLDDRGIPYWLGKGGRICTTQAAVDAAMLQEAVKGRVDAEKRAAKRETLIEFV